MIFNRLSVTAFAIALGLSVPSAAPAASKDIVETAAAAGQFETLAAALTAADLVGTLQGDGPFTVFAPTDEAFAALPEGTVETLLKPENRAQLTEILTYHVVPGKVMSSDLSDGMTAETVMGKEITVSMDGGVKINDATVTAADIETSNGIIHVIDTVILP
ncbi:fasciclin domain-containing protein [Leisingera sp. D0M16]|uniref:fasciclin domain-containing protein n=1 Tax=Leisingera coralii TaxID=3351347 RepID=UPI003B809EEC